MASSRTIWAGVISILPIIFAIPIGFFILVAVGMAFADGGGQVPPSSTAEIVILTISTVLVILFLILPSAILLIFKRGDFVILAAAVPLFFEFFILVALGPAIRDLLHWAVPHLLRQ